MIFWKTFELVVSPVASCPFVFAPQLQSEPDSSKNKEWEYPLLPILSVFRVITNITATKSKEIKQAFNSFHAS